MNRTHVSNCSRSCVFLCIPAPVSRSQNASPLSNGCWFEDKMLLPPGNAPCVSPLRAMVYELEAYGPTVQ